MIFTHKQILITVKAYPNLSEKYGETVCTAGIDLATNKWIRIYPIPWRDLEYKKKFRKYDIIEADVIKNPSDTRPESYKINCDSIKVIHHLNTSNKWKNRKEIILPSASESMCEISRNCQDFGISLGCFKPDPKVGFSWEEKPENEDDNENNIQLNFFNPKKNKLELLPYSFKFQYYCLNEPSCKGHNQSIIDWEIGESFRAWQYPLEEKLDKIRQKWTNEMFSHDKDTYIFVGNHHLYKTFMVLGIFWPPKAS